MYLKQSTQKLENNQFCISCPVQSQESIDRDGGDWRATNFCEKLSFLSNFCCLHLNTASYSSLGSNNELIVSVKDLGNWL